MKAATETETIRILLVEDEPAHADRILARLPTAGPFSVESRCVALAFDAVAELRHTRYDVILLDQTLPDGAGTGVYLRVRDAAPDTPVLILTDRHNEFAALKAVHAGAADYIFKGEPDEKLLPRIIRYTLERRRTERALAHERERLAVTLASIADGVITTDVDGRITLMNPVAEALTGYARDAAVGRALKEVYVALDPETRARLDPLGGVLTGRGEDAGVQRDRILASPKGVERVVAESVAPLRDRDGNVVGAVLAFRDVTRQRQTEEELLRTSKLESLGVLAGGLAHDFNNLLASILGHLSLIEDDRSDAEEVRHAVSEALGAARRARALTHRFLTFSRGGAPVRTPASVEALVRRAVEMIPPETSRRYDLRFEDGLHPVEVDVDQVGQALNAVLVNACQASADDGVVRVLCQNVRLTPGAGTHRALPLADGDYVRITVRDEGAGIESEHMARIFDPYFSTRPGGRGLGLATAFSILRKHGGHIAAASRPGAGSRFDLYLPAMTNENPAGANATAPAPAVAGQHILVMDDDAVVARVVQRMLERLGYRVETARDGGEALQRYQQAMQDGDPFAAVIMDLTVPGGMGGREAIGKLLEIDPGARAIVSSGYSSDPVMAEYRSHGFQGVIAKPYDLDQLRTTLATVLAGDQG